MKNSSVLLLPPWTWEEKPCRAAEAGLWMHSRCVWPTLVSFKGPSATGLLPTNPMLVTRGASVERKPVGDSPFPGDADTC